MGTLIVNFVGANAYVPHQDGTKLLVVMPNASKLGRSPQGALDGTPLSRHMPCLWEEGQEAGVRSIRGLRTFLGSRLEILPEGTPTDLDLTAVRARFESPWLHVDEALLEPTHDDRLSAQAVLSHGTIEEYVPGTASTGCIKEWPDPAVSLDTGPILTGLKVTMQEVDGVILKATPWVDAQPDSLYIRKLDKDETVTLFIGNQCAEHILRWPRQNERPPGLQSKLQKTVDSDFRWLYQLTENPADLKPYPAPLVDGSAIERNFTVHEAFDSVWGGGGGAACECNGCAGDQGP